MSALRLRQAVQADISSVVNIWVDAFAHDPFLRWIQPVDESWPAFAQAWLSFLAEVGVAHGQLHLDEHAGVAASWVPAGVPPLTVDDIMRGRQVLEEHGGEARADQAFDTILSVRDHLPTTPHWTLQSVGVLTQRQGMGIGSAVVGAQLAVCDGQGVPCRLVSKNPRNLPFFERLGFVSDAEVPTPDGATTLRTMNRPPVE